MRERTFKHLGTIALLMVALPGTAQAAALDSSAIPPPWGLPFVGLLLTIATGPLLFPKIWHEHYGKIGALWAFLSLVPFAATYDIAAAAEVFVHAMLAEYMSFIVVLFALYTVAGGILVTGDLRGTPAHNAALLATGAGMASIVGTTGAAMILIRPLLRANESRRYRAHVVVFFIILVANIGGALSPLGDPPLFVGFLKGVDFFWPARNLWMQTAFVAAIVLGMFVVVDWLLLRREGAKPRGGPAEPLRIRGTVNIPLMGMIIVSILASTFWKPGIEFTIFGTTIAIQNLARDAVLILIALASLWLTPDEHRAANGFTWEPIREVAKLFAAIFVAIAPVIAMLQAGKSGPLTFLLTAVTANDGLPHEAAYFWLTGLLSALLDNAPTYLVFFQLAGGNAEQLMGPMAGTLAAISMGAVYMGALSYIGNAPNLMVYAIAQERGVNMPSFFGYMGWASLILMPLFLLLTFLPISPILKFN